MMKDATVTIPMEEFNRMQELIRAYEAQSLTFMDYRGVTWWVPASELGAQLQQTHKQLEEQKNLVSRYNEMSRGSGMQLLELQKAVHDYNALPWYRRIFTKP